MSQIQERIQCHLDTLVSTGAETGVQVAAYHDGALIVDAVAGTADPATDRPITSQTPIFSTASGLASQDGSARLPRPDTRHRHARTVPHRRPTPHPSPRLSPTVHQPRAARLSFAGRLTIYPKTYVSSFGLFRSWPAIVLSGVGGPQVTG